jgi:hypothetical protein
MVIKRDITKSGTRVVQMRGCLRRNVSARRSDGLVSREDEQQESMFQCRRHPGERSDHLARQERDMISGESDEQRQTLNLSRSHLSTRAVAIPGLGRVVGRCFLDLADELLLCL